MPTKNGEQTTEAQHWNHGAKGDTMNKKKKLKNCVHYSAC